MRSFSGPSEHRGIRTRIRLRQACSVYINLIIFKDTGSLLLSHTVSNIVPSAVRVLTVVFGMGTGVSPGRIATSKI